MVQEFLLYILVVFQYITNSFVFLKFGVVYINYLIMLCSPYPVPSPHGHVIACRITSENPDEVSIHFVY